MSCIVSCFVLCVKCFESDKKQASTLESGGEKVRGLFTVWYGTGLHTRR